MSQEKSSITKLDVPERILNCLLRAGVETIEDLAGYSTKEIATFQGLGKKATETIKAAYTSFSGYSLREYDFEIASKKEDKKDQKKSINDEINTCSEVLFGRSPDDSGQEFPRLEYQAADDVLIISTKMPEGHRSEIYFEVDCIDEMLNELKNFKKVVDFLRKKT